MTNQERAVVDKSTRLMVAGMEAIQRSTWAEAAEIFARAGRLRDTLPWRGNGEFAWMIAGAWLNHGDMLLRSGEPALRRDAIASFDKVIEVMSVIQLDAKPAFAERLILTRLNRATAWFEEGENNAAIPDFDEAQRLLGIWGEEATPASRFLSAMLRVNRARLRIAEGEALAALEDIRAGLARLDPLGVSVETGKARIQAWSLRCRALALLLDQPQGAEKVGDWIAEATDSAEEALKWVRVSGCRDGWVNDLVRYGAKIYQACQPHFLGEFLIEWLGPNGSLRDDRSLRKEMGGLLLLAQVEVERTVLAFAHETEVVEAQTRVLCSLQQAMAALS